MLNNIWMLFHFEHNIFQLNVIWDNIGLEIKGVWSAHVNDLYNVHVLIFLYIPAASQIWPSSTLC